MKFDIKKIIVLISSVAILIGCSDFLDESPESALTSSSFFQSEDDAVAAVTGVYSRLTNRFGAFQRGLYNRNYFWIYQNAGNETRGRGGTRPNINNFTVDATESLTTDTWGASVIAISYIATTIDGINNVPEMTLQRRAELIGELKFLRALLYFNLVEAFGPSPLIIDAPKVGDDFNIPHALLMLFMTKLLLICQMPNQHFPRLGFKKWEDRPKDPQRHFWGKSI